MCWNCDRPARAAVGAPLRAPSGAVTIVTLCEECYVSAYLPLAGELEGPTGDDPPGATS